MITKEGIIQKIIRLLERYDSEYPITFYFDDKRICKLDRDLRWYTEDEKYVEDYLRFYNKDTITMVFDGKLYYTLNYNACPDLKKDFIKLLDMYGYYYEMGSSTTLALFYKN